MSDVPNGPGWWQASDGNWYPPEQFGGPTAEPGTPPSAPAQPQTGPNPTAPTAEAPPQGAEGPQGPGWWQASDGKWYPPQASPAYPVPQPVPGYPYPYDPLAKSKMAAGLLGIFLGGFGVHRFYLGYTSIGIIQIVVTIVTCGIGALWGFVEGILILAGQESFRTDASGRPLRE